MEDMTNAPATVSAPTTRIVEGVIAETSEPVEIEEDDDDDDEDLGLCIVSEAGEEIDDREPRREVAAETSIEQESEVAIEDETEVTEDIINAQSEKADDDASVLPDMSEEELVADPATSELAAEEIDDVEPAAEEGGKGDRPGGGVGDRLAGDRHLATWAVRPATILMNIKLTSTKIKKCGYSCKEENRCILF